MDPITVSVVHRLDELADSGMNKPLQTFVDNVKVLLPDEYTPKIKSIEFLQFQLSDMKNFQSYYHSFEQELTTKILPKLLANNNSPGLKEMSELLNAVLFRFLQMMYTAINYLEDDLYSKKQELYKRRDKRERYKLNKTIRKIENGQQS